MKKNFWKSAVSAVSACALMLTAAACSIQAGAFDNSVREGTVMVGFYLKNVAVYTTTDGKSLQFAYDLEDGVYSSGTGFFVGNTKENPEYIVTNCHVVDSYIEANEGEEYLMVAGYDMNSSGYITKIYYIGADSCEMRIYYSDNDYDVAYVDCYGDVGKVDLAVLRIREGTDKRHALKLFAPTQDMVGETVYTVGYPGNADNDFTSASKYGIADATISSGIMSKLAVNEGKGVERIQTDATIHHGNSGGPLVNEAGFVIGVNTNVYSTSPYQNQIEADYYALSGGELMRFLDKNNIPYEVGSLSGSVNTGAVVGVIAVVVIVGGAAAFFVMKKKGGSGSSAPKASQKGAPKAIVRSLSPQHNGKTYPVGKAALTVGRNASGCEIVYQEGTPGVSGQHCTVSFDSGTGAFTLTDLGSSYGTFLSNGMKLTAHSPIQLKPGDSFYVGDKANVLKLELEQ